jgi:hypothetical protein
MKLEGRQSRAAALDRYGPQLACSSFQEAQDYLVNFLRRLILNPVARTGYSVNYLR